MNEKEKINFEANRIMATNFQVMGCEWDYVRICNHIAHAIVSLNNSGYEIVKKQ